MTDRKSLRVSASWLHEHREDAGLRIVDSSVHLTFDEDGAHVASGRETYLEGHIPGAVFADLTTPGFTDPAGEAPFAVSGSASFAAAVGALGIGDGDTVVLYDHVNGIWATRLWWQFQLEGHDVLVLDGGLAAWEAAGFERVSGAVVLPEATFTARRREDRIVATSEVEAALDDDGVLLIEALAAPLYARGHIPGAVNVPFEGLYREDGTLRDRDELVAIFENVGGLDPGVRPVAYCGGGISATAVAFALHELGRDDIAVYDGSKNAWTKDPSRALETA